MHEFIKAHAYGNDFLYVRRQEVRDLDVSRLAQRMCDRHVGIGADGLIVYDLTSRGASMRLRNADGSSAEVSGNGMRGLAAILARSLGERSGEALIVETESGEKRLTLEHAENGRYTFRAWMGLPVGLREATLDILGDPVHAVILSMGNPQCVLLGPLDDARFRRLGPAIEKHTAFPEGTNVEFVDVEQAGRLRILIWERGCGPTQASGTGACAAAVAAAAYGGASHEVDVSSPGGSQHVEWAADGVYLTGWAEIVASGHWLLDD
jgi:diaminopimelate epimerase